MRKSIFMVMLALLLAVPAFGVNKDPMKELIVASDGEFTTITAALASLPTPNPDTNPVVIKVMPGTYTEDIVMKSNVHLEGAGRNVTIIQSPSIGTAVTINSLVNVAISGFTIRDAIRGIKITSSSPTIKENIIQDSEYGIYSESNSSPVISDNLFVGDRNCTEAIRSNYSSPVIIGNTITGSGCSAIWNDTSTPTIIGNKITLAGVNANGIGGLGFDSSTTISGNVVTGSTYIGINFSCASGATPVITNNRVTGNGLDIKNSSCGNISSNVFDTISGTIHGSFNVKSDGTPW